MFKGSDAALFCACTSLGLRPLLRLAYEEPADFGRVLMNMPTEVRHDIDDNTFNTMCDEYGGARTRSSSAMAPLRTQMTGAEGISES